MKGILKILVISITLVLFTSTIYAGNTTKQPSATTPPSKKIAWIASHMQNEFVLDMAKAAESAGKAIPTQSR